MEGIAYVFFNNEPLFRYSYWNLIRRLYLFVYDNYINFLLSMEFHLDHNIVIVHSSI